jgi:hypothetical protein
MLAYANRRWHQITIILGLLSAVVILLVTSRSLQNYWQNLRLNLAVDLIGVIVALFVITPFIQRAELRLDSVLERFDHRAFIRQAADARRQILILTTWTDLLQGSYRQPFLKSLQAALYHNVEVRILLLDPDAKAAEQRTDDLRRETNVVDKIMENMQTLHTFREAHKSLSEGKLQIRIYSALPPVQMYQVDDYIVVSFYPLNSTSWQAAQYQTSSQAQLGTFVSAKFDELWDAPGTRTLDQFWKITVSVGLDANLKETYHVEFVTSSEATYVCGQHIIFGHSSRGIDGLLGRIVKSEREITGLYSFLHLDANSEDCKIAGELFIRKYGQEYCAILKLVETSSE